MILSQRLNKRFDEVRRAGEAALIGYIMTGEPQLERTVEYIQALEAGGLDVLELGVPFTDPIADGPILQAAHTRALRQGVTVHTALQIVRELRVGANPRIRHGQTQGSAPTELPILLMTYYNPVFKMGEESFARRCSEAGVDGVIIPDLPIEEAASWVNQARKYGLARVFFATPETDNERVKKICEYASGFLYLVSRYGTTGVNETLAPTAIPLIERVRPLVPQDLRIAVGFGFSTRAQIETVVRAGADGVIVGSALAARIAEGASPEAITDYVRELKAGTRR
uniref:Tryptophan synthase alpha chain n=1 Tax=Acetithermum autotrophicum TaxID=1446466 RepID=H5SVD8_ACEAU|nr:tryptophan synthase alpha chain [Candidatus Acetothermum autotrophicum]